MSIMRNRLLSAAVLSAALFLINGCILNPETEKPPPPEPIDWPDLTEKEDVIETITLCYENYNTATDSDLELHYSDILYDEPDNEYVFNLHFDDYLPGGKTFLSLTEDVAGTMYVLNHSTGLILDLSSSQWDPDENCDDCWRSTRVYTITTTIEVNGEFRNLSGNDMKVMFVIRPQHDDPTKWAIFIAQDLANQ